MTTATIQAFRQIATTEQKTMTAREMALTSHNLNHTGEIATTKDGRKFYWSNARNLWIG
jgi:hypothetical protein